MLEVSQTCYAEKHRVYEMFRNMVKALIMCQPPDPLRFIFWYLKHGRYTDVPKIVLIAPPGLRTADKVYIALHLAKSTGVVTIDRQNVLRRRQRKRQENENCSVDFVSALIEYMRAKGTSEKGWLLLDIPNSGKEADRLISVGILPTHTIVLNVAAKHPDGDRTGSIIVDKLDARHERFEFEMKIKFRYSLTELSVRGKSIDEISELCLEQILWQRPSSTLPFTPRITLIGPEGSRRFVTANALATKFNIVHVDFDQLLVQKNITDLREVAPETIYSWLKERLTENKCVEKGYVLTGFPRTKTEFEWLDSIEVIPNRVIFLAVDFCEVYSRLRNRCVDKKSGTIISLDQAIDKLKLGSLKSDHVGRYYPSNPKKLFCQFKTYCDRLKDMLYYCGNSCFVVTAEGSLFEKVVACVLSGSPASGPRPQNRKPSRLTEKMNEKMLLSYNDEALCKNTRLTDEAKNLLFALENANVV